MKKVLLLCSLFFSLLTAYAQDLWTKDNGADGGAEPSAPPHYQSPDIWIRNAPDYGTAHQNAIYGQWNYVYVKVRNRDAAPFTPKSPAKLFLYWAKAGVFSSWPAHWNGSVPVCSPPAYLGDMIGAQMIPGVLGGGEVVLQFAWWPPTPSDFSCLFADRISHFCLLSRIQTENAYPHGMTAPETSGIGDNIAKNNNISMRNIDVYKCFVPYSPMSFDILLGGTAHHTVATNGHTLRFAAPEEEQQDPLHRHARIIVDLGQFGNAWVAAGAKGQGIRLVDNDRAQGVRVELVAVNATIEGLRIADDELGAIGVEITQIDAGVRGVFNLDMDFVADNGRVINGQVFQANFNPCTQATGDVDVIAAAKKAVAAPNRGPEVSNFIAAAANGLLTVRVSDNKPYTLELADANGRPMTTKKFNNQTQVPVSTYAPGVYLVRLTPTAGGEAQVKKVLIN